MANVADPSKRYALSARHNLNGITTLVYPQDRSGGDNTKSEYTHMAKPVSPDPPRCGTASPSPARFMHPERQRRLKPVQTPKRKRAAPKKPKKKDYLWPRTRPNITPKTPVRTTTNTSTPKPANIRLRRHHTRMDNGDVIDLSESNDEQDVNPPKSPTLEYTVSDSDDMDYTGDKDDETQQSE